MKPKQVLAASAVWFGLTGFFVAVDNLFAVSEKISLFAFTGTFVPIICAAFILFGGKEKLKTVNIRTPKRSRYKNYDASRIESYSLIVDGKAYAEKATNANNLKDFFHYWDKVIETLDQLSAFEGKVDFVGETPSRNKKKLVTDFQIKIQAAIIRSKEKVISDILDEKTPFFKNQIYDSFCDDMKEFSPRFSPETKECANHAISEVIRALQTPALSYPAPNIAPAKKASASPASKQKVKAPARKNVGGSPIELELERVDRMDGYTFERWCASLLRASGFIDVEVTRSSGDQGVDVLATLDRVRYAVQCKCYSSNLGNDPVQEVYAGIALYHCQVGSVMTNRYFTAGAKELAKATGIHLWDRDWIISLLQELKPDVFPLPTDQN